MQTLEFRAMNTSVLMAAEGDEQAISGLQAARAFIEVSEKRFSRFLPESELSQLNGFGGKWYSVSEDLMELLTLSLRYFDETGGLFNPAILPDLKRAGYDKSMDSILTQGPGDGYNRMHIPQTSLRDIDFDITNGRVRLPKTMEIDLGGMAKGWIVEKASNLLRSYSSTCAVSAGGDIVFVGNPLSGSKWEVELEDPRNPDQTTAVLFVGQCAVVTSSITKRTWSQNGQIRHHLIDPRTGEPAKTDWLSVTVISSEITEAEAFAKALLIGGRSEAGRLTSKYPELAYISVDPEGHISGSQFGKEYLNEYDRIFS
jgi:thiamine biosynthesis lipoprotein